ncbi:MAG TPA: hypothetical protein VGJ16_04410, partial [Pirellulales bacterium]
MLSFLLGLSIAAGAAGCSLHPPYGPFNDNTTIIPPLGKLTHRNNLPPANMLMEPGPGVGGPGPGIMATAESGSPFVRTSQVAFT